jgi:hypothetical protein
MLPWTLAVLFTFAATKWVVVGVSEEPEIENSKRNMRVT